MAVTVQQVVDFARPSLNDDAKTRWPDADCAIWVNDGVEAIYTLRPDIFIGQFSTYAPYSYDLADPLPVPDRYKGVLGQWIIAAAHLVDEEGAVADLATAAVQFFGARLT